MHGNKDVNPRAGWEVEGFIDRLRRRDGTNGERLVLEAIGHLRSLSRDCDELRAAKRRALAVADERSKENVALRAALSACVKAMGEVQDHWGDPASWMHNELETPLLVHADAIAKLELR